MSAVSDRFELEERLRKPARGEPVWLLARQFPAQGHWTEERYLDLETDQPLEYVRGYLEFPPVPTRSHQRMIRHLVQLIQAFLEARGLGEALPAGYRVRVADGVYREPDVVTILRRSESGAGEKFTDTADLVVEIVSQDDPNRDWVEKKAEYAAAGIPEYWIADPRDNTLTIFTLDDGATEYREAGRYKEGETAASVLLEGLTVEVAKVFAAE